MFQSLNLFKAINCPFYSQNSNTSTCERPYCQFKHPKSSSTTASIEQTDLLTKDDYISESYSEMWKV